MRTPDLLNERIIDYFVPRAWYNLLPRGSYPLEIVFPSYEMLRAEVFVEDIKKASGLKRFKLRDLIALLLDDFIENIRLDSNITELLVDLKARVNRIRATQVRQDEGRMSVTVYVTYDTLLRVQVLLRDLRDIDEAFALRVEGLIRILISDIVWEIKKGSGKKLATAVLQSLEK